MLYAYYSFNVYFSKSFPFIFFGKIWSQNLKFFKLTEIWYSGRLLFAYFDFDVYFLKIFVIHIFSETLVPKSEVLQINWHLVLANTFKCLSWFWCLVFQNFYIQQIWAKSNVLHIDWNLMQGHIVVCWLHFWCIICRSICLHEILGKTSFQNLLFSIFTEI